jgi:hypothetical protein
VCSFSFSQNERYVTMAQVKRLLRKYHNTDCCLLPVATLQRLGDILLLLGKEQSCAKVKAKQLSQAQTKRSPGECMSPEQG